MDKVPMLSLLAFFLSALSVRAIVEDTVATDFFILGDATFAGTGCSSRDVIVLLSSAHDGKDLLHLSFAQSFRAQSGATTKALRERETCNGVIPITPKSGYSIGITANRIVGFVSVPTNDVGSYAQVTSSAFFAGGEGPKIQKKFDSAGSGPFALETGADAVIVWSKCGTASSLRINTALITNGPETIIAFESLKEHGLLYSISLKSCAPGSK